MTRINHFLYSLDEAHIRLTCDEMSLHADGLPEGAGNEPLPEYCQSGLHMVFGLLSRLVPDLCCISVLGVWKQGAPVPFHAFDIWLQTGDGGFYLPARSAASLFSENGIPYFHLPEN